MSNVKSNTKGRRNVSEERIAKRTSGKESGNTAFPQQGERRNSQQSEWEERVIEVKRVTKVVKGGKNMSFRVLVVVGDQRGNFGVGVGKADEVVDAVKKAVEDAKKNMVKVPFEGGSIPHNSFGKSNSSGVYLYKAKKGTGLIAALMVKVALELAGLHNVVCKVQGSTNPRNVLLALVRAIKNIKTKGQIRILRGTGALGANSRKNTAAA